jgi:hypothetical protein
MSAFSMSSTNSALRSAADVDEERELALGGPHLGQVDEEETDRVAVEFPSAALVAFYLGQTADIVSFETTMKRRSGQLRDRGLQGVETVLKRQ